MIPEFLIPATLVLAAALLLPRPPLAGPKAKPWAIQLVLLAVAGVVARYLYWRVTETMPAPGTGAGELAFYWTVFSIEALVWIDTAILFLMLSRPRHNSADADRGEAVLRGTDPTDLPSVDVFIATYNEDLDVLEKTIIGAQAIDWPRTRLRIYILDDGKRDWLKDYCAKRGVDYLTRSTNEHAKAGNINAAISRTEGEYFLILDADFIPQKNILYRGMGLFEDPKVGIVQIPHSFYNSDPMQTNLGLRKVLPDDQRFFFGTVMSGRDGWNAAFCCGSNSITRRSAMEAIGNKLPTGSITEDMLLTLALLRKGFVTRYLNERLALGLAPESLSAMYVQRARWARGAIQIIFLKDGPFGPDLKWHERLMFIPLHWLAQPLAVLMTLLMPMVCLWTGWAPLSTASVADTLSFQITAVLAVLATLRIISPGGFFPIASAVHTCVQAPRTLPTIITTLIRPHGHAFKVTPKGKAAEGGGFDKVMLLLPGIVIILTAMGIYINGDINTRILDSIERMPFLVVWAVISMIVLTIVQAVAISRGGEVREESFPLDLTCDVMLSDGRSYSAVIDRLSVTEARLSFIKKSDVPQDGSFLDLRIPQLGMMPGVVSHDERGGVAVVLCLPDASFREDLMKFLFTEGRDNTTPKVSAIRIVNAMLMRAAGWGRASRSKRAD